MSSRTQTSILIVSCHNYSFPVECFRWPKIQTCPFLERLRYLTITSGVLDEFFEIRVAGLKEQVAFGTVQREADNLSAEEQLAQIEGLAKDFVADLYATLNDELVPAMRAEKIRVLRSSEWGADQFTWLKSFFS